MKKKGRKDFLTRNEIKEVTPQLIAYAALQVCPFTCQFLYFDLPLPQTYVGLSSMKEWGTTDGAFNLVRFYHLIIKTLSHKTDQWVVQTINWWNKYTSTPSLSHLTS